MFKYLASWELWGTLTFILVGSLILGHGDLVNGFGNMANIKQNLDWLAWSYVIYRLHRQHKLSKQVHEILKDYECILAFFYFGNDF